LNFSSAAPVPLTASPTERSYYPSLADGWRAWMQIAVAPPHRPRIALQNASCSAASAARLCGLATVTPLDPRTVVAYLPFLAGGGWLAWLGAAAVGDPWRVFAAPLPLPTPGQALPPSIIIATADAACLNCGGSATAAATAAFAWTSEWCGAVFVMWSSGNDGNDASPVRFAAATTGQRQANFSTPVPLAGTEGGQFPSLVSFDHISCWDAESPDGRRVPICHVLLLWTRATAGSPRGEIVKASAFARGGVGPGLAVARGGSQQRHGAGARRPGHRGVLRAGGAAGAAAGGHHVRARLGAAARARRAGGAHNPLPTLQRVANVSQRSSRLVGHR